MPLHEFAQRPLGRGGRVMENFDRMVSPDPLFHRFRNQLLFADAQKLALPGQPFELF